MDEYKIVYKGFESIVLPYDEVLNNLISRLRITEAKAGKLIRGPKVTLKIANQEQDALKFQSLFHKLGLATEIVMPIELEPLPESEPAYDNDVKPSLDQQTAETSTLISAPTKVSLTAYIKKYIFGNPLFKLSNTVLLFGVLLVVVYFPFIDGVVRYGFAMGVVLMASSLSLKSVDR